MARLRRGPSGKVRGDQGERGRRDDRGTDALDSARGQQPGLAGGESAEQRSGGEQDDAGDEDPPAAKDVAGPATEQQQAAEGQGVGVDHPLQAGAGEAERGLDMRERDIDDRGVEYHHQLSVAMTTRARPRWRWRRSGGPPAGAVGDGGAARLRQARMTWQTL